MATPVTELRTAVVGTGLIGGSILLRLHDAGVPVTGWDPDPETRRYARQHGLTFADDLTDAVAGCDLVFLCGPLATLPDTLVEVARATGDHCVLTDVGSTKSAVAACAREHDLGHRFVPGHPMAGTERAGLAAADPTLMRGAAWVLCPPEPGPMHPFRMLTDLLIAVFEARVVPMSAAMHDSVAALASHIPHLLAGSLAGAVARSPLRDAVLALAAGSFRDGTRVAGTPSSRTAHMLISNREFVLRQVELVEGFLAELLAALRDDDTERLISRYTQSRKVRDELLARPLTRSVRSFPVNGPHDAELGFLLELGRQGGHLTRIETDASTVCYHAQHPAPSKDSM